MKIDLKKILKENKRLWIFLVIIFAFGLASGIFYGIQDNTAKNFSMIQNISTLCSTTPHFFFEHFFVLSAFFVASFAFLSIPCMILYLFWEGLSIGFTIMVFIAQASFAGFFFIFIFQILAKGPFLCLYFLLAQKFIKLNKAIFRMWKEKRDKRNLILEISLRAILLIFCIAMYDLIFEHLLFKIICHFQISLG